MPAKKMKTDAELDAEKATLQAKLAKIDEQKYQAKIMDALKDAKLRELFASIKENIKGATDEIILSTIKIMVKPEKTPEQIAKAAEAARKAKEKAAAKKAASQT